jgi:glycosyltransferase involved in cell wall biosynthesis
MPEILKHTKLKIKWIHIGGVKGEAYNELNSLCLKYGIDFIFLGQLTTKEIFEFYRKYEVSLFCNLSYAEGIPVSLMEAAMFGIPLLATNTFGNPEIVNGENGIIIPVEFEPMKVAASIDAFFSNQTEWETKSKKSRTKFSDDFDAEKNLNQFLSKLSSIL